MRKLFPAQIIGCVPPSNASNRILIFWLAGCALLVYVMVVLGGITRLTHSGLSMVEWKPLMGIIPPVSEADWLSVFGRYKQSPEYEKINSGMRLSEFKSIFYFEYAHRLLGRLIGLVFLVPFLVLWYKKRLSRKLGISLLLIFILGGLQGVLGWYMVQSGLIDEPSVSQYRLTAHLGLAAALFGALLWILTGIVFKSGTRQYLPGRKIKQLIVLLLVLVYTMILLGGLLAGLKAGLMWNTFPLMGDTFLPIGLYDLSPWYLSAFEDRTTVQFNHRIVAYSIVILSIYLSITVMQEKMEKLYKTLVMVWCLMIAGQVLLGILTLLHFVPTPMAALHQGSALLVFGLGVVLVRLAFHPDCKAKVLYET